MSLLKANQLNQLKVILKETSTFETIQNIFGSSFPRNTHFAVSCSLGMLVRNDLLEPQEQIVAIFLLCYLFSIEQQNQQNKKEDQIISSFIVPIIELVSRVSSQNQSERIQGYFALIFLDNIKSDFLKKTSLQILDISESDWILFTSHLKNESPHELLIKNTLDLTKNHNIGFPSQSPLIPDPNPEPSNSLFTDDDFDEVNKFHFVSDEFQPPFIQPAPGLLGISDSEIQWIDFENDHFKSIFDYLLEEQSIETQTKNLIEKSSKFPLSEEEENLLKILLQEDPQLFDGIDFTSSFLSQIIESNKMIAIEIIKNLFPKQTKDLLSKLEQINLSPQFLEVISEITKSLNLSLEFISKFILNSIQNLKKIQDQNQFQTLMHYFCDFVDILLKESSFSKKFPQNIIGELKSFSLENSNIKKSTELFKTLNNFDK
ncbi:ccr4-not transcription complex subunit 11 [Anaeramoeba ignava]|uniref:CCR4-NOT transcription complex subunit 11 n=1 Tax=Anaeramoeba ignava TaxID=1746090 RepID=A0A9Q0LWQ0_ANAIG|nr:ccr4-not transcription complex subunit 11 [Anaeramoeba ignava]